MPLTLSEAYLAGLTSTSVLYGISVVTYYACVRALIFEAWQRRAITWTRIVMFACATGMWLVATVGVGQMLQHMLNAFVHYKGEGGADASFSTLEDPMNVVHALTYPIQAAMGDSFLVYRTWIVYGRSWRVTAFPMIVLLGDLVAGFGITAAELSIRQSDPSITVADPRISSWITAFFTLTLCLNVLCTGLIIFRISFITRKASSSRVTESPLQRIMRIVLESGLIYTATSLIVLIIVIMKSNALYIAADSFIPITAICFHLIILRTDVSREEGSSHEHSPSLPLHFVRHKATNATPVAPTVTVSRHIDTDSIHSTPVDFPDELWPRRFEKAKE